MNDVMETGREDLAELVEVYDTAIAGLEAQGYRGWWLDSLHRQRLEVALLASP